MGTNSGPIRNIKKYVEVFLRKIVIPKMKQYVEQLFTVNITGLVEFL